MYQLNLMILRVSYSTHPGSAEPGYAFANSEDSEANWSASTLLVIKYVICINNLDQVIWLAKIKSGRGILIYSAGHG